MELNQFPDNKLLPQAIYRAVGWMAGTYQPSEENVNTGILITEDGKSLPAKITGRLRGNLSKKHPDYASQPDLFSQPQRWTVYPKTEPLRFELVVMKPLAPEPVGVPPLDEFRIVGEIISSSDGIVKIRIRRNLPYVQGDKTNKKHSFVLTLKGSLPDSSVGQVWALEVKRQAENLVVVSSELYTPSEEDKAFLERIANQTAEAFVAAKNSTPEPTVEEPERSRLSSGKALANPTDASISQETKGETELSPQSNAELQAQKNVASESKRTTTINTADTQQQELPTEQQPQSITTPTDTAAVLGSQSKFFVQSTPNPKAFTRPQRSQPPKSTPNHQKPESSPGTPTQREQTTSPTAKPKAAHKPQQLEKKQPKLSNNQDELKQKQPVFQVKVDNRVYNGVSSVILKNRLVYVDDKPVASGKMAIVLGSPKIIQADGKVTQGENQALLIGK